MTQNIDIKGIREGLVIRVSDNPDVAISARLQRELAEKQAFLRGSRIAVDLGSRAMTGPEIAELQRLFEESELTLWAILTEDAETRERARAAGLATRLSGSATDLEGNALPAEPLNGAAAPTAKPLPPPNALLIQETLRSGRSVWHEGHVVVLGDVNPGAEIVAAGNVVVWGHLRGLVHAGAFGDSGAMICALDLSPTQLRIADQIAVAPDDGLAGPGPEQAVIRDGQIVAEPWVRPVAKRQ